jgi:hypothetical protein
MVDVKAIWDDCLPDIKDSVTGVGIWAALNAAVPVALEDKFFVLGLGVDDLELAGHLRIPQTRREIELAIAREVNSRVDLRVISGTAQSDWETEKKRDAEKRRLQERALERARKEAKAGKSWESIYEQLSRQYAATPNRSLPQNRAKFLLEAVDILSSALIETPITDDLAERNFARCIERIAQYTDLPSAFVAVQVLDRTFKG